MKISIVTLSFNQLAKLQQAIGSVLRLISASENVGAVSYNGFIFDSDDISGFVGSTFRASALSDAGLTRCRAIATLFGISFPRSNGQRCITHVPQTFSETSN